MNVKDDKIRNQQLNIVWRSLFMCAVCVVRQTYNCVITDITYIVITWGFTWGATLGMSPGTKTCITIHFYSYMSW